MRENDLLSQLPPLFATNDPSVLIGVGPDDCAHVITPTPNLAFSTDAFVENIHFLPSDEPNAVAVKAIAAAVSDLAASACRPLWALVCLCLKKSAPENWAKEFGEALAKTANSYAMTIIGGDTTSSPRDTVIAVTVAGVPLPGGPLLRSGAKTDDVIIVTGRLGGSILGRHLRPAARVREIAVLMNYCTEQGPKPPTAAMDISDGLSLDLSRLCRESKVGAVLDSSLIPISAAAQRLAEQTGKDALYHALTDGEDFELLLTMSEISWGTFDCDQKTLGCIDVETGEALFRRIGRIVETKELSLLDERGATHPLFPEGYQHQW